MSNSSSSDHHSRWQRIRRRGDHFRHRLAHTDALPQMAILGCLCGLLTGLVAVLFRLSFEVPLHSLLDSSGTEAFEALSTASHFLMPFCGILLVGTILHFVKPHRRNTGISHVVNRVHQHQGRLPSGNALVQFVCGSLLLSSGAPVGREGPAVHLGAACGSALGGQMKLPNNNLRVLAGCGVAAAIAASFNMPLAGVIFAMEVVLMEYTIAGFMPIILAAVCGTVVSRVFYGDDPAFLVPAMELGSLLELPYIAVCGLLIGIVAAGLLRFHLLGLRFQDRPILLRAAVAALIAGSAGVALPQLLGLGYDTISNALLGQLGLGMLVAIGVTKLLVASSIISMGMPGGIISPALVSGACLGGALGIVAGLLMPQQSSAVGLYAMVGMGAMMAAVLNAPLAALLAVLELTYTPGIVMPAMLAIMVATLTARLLSRQPGIFLGGRDLNRFSSPVYQMLSRAGVTSLMCRQYQTCGYVISRDRARELLADKPECLVVEDVGEPKLLVRPADLAHFLEEHSATLWEEDSDIHLREIPGDHRQLKPIHARATLQEALQLMRQENVQAVYISRARLAPLQSEVQGVLTKEQIEGYYQ
ncbi:chloride channel protein [Porticoccus sp. W117]|uniref:chloride channel protein n=1 Tax=Porticoccus sp. W117 TaxID=3054777 RepID=UPI002592F089|nr:chloride channel protein [Porticoccus sp. W117]MDM3872598.1 chloride channel protein [Porticoccus sp. W117]